MAVDMIEKPSFITHNAQSHDFSIYTDSLDDVGQHTVKFECTVHVPTDYTRSVTIAVTKEAQFVLNVDATCDATHFVDWALKGQTVQSFVKG